MISPFIPSLSMSFPKVHALSNIPLLFHCLTQGLTLSATAGGGEQVGALLDRCHGTSPEGVGEWRKREGGQASRRGQSMGIFMRCTTARSVAFSSHFTTTLPHFPPVQARLRRGFRQAHYLAVISRSHGCGKCRTIAISVLNVTI